MYISKICVLSPYLHTICAYIHNIADLLLYLLLLTRIIVISRLGVLQLYNYNIMYICLYAMLV